MDIEVAGQGNGTRVPRCLHNDCLRGANDRIDAPFSSMLLGTFVMPRKESLVGIYVFKSLWPMAVNSATTDTYIDN